MTNDETAFLEPRDLRRIAEDPHNPAFESTIFDVFMALAEALEMRPSAQSELREDDAL